MTWPPVAVLTQSADSKTVIVKEMYELQSTKAEAVVLLEDVVLVIVNVRVVVVLVVVLVVVVVVVVWEATDHSKDDATTLRPPGEPPDVTTNAATQADWQEFDCWSLPSMAHFAWFNDRERPWNFLHG
jgi:hypothetical protein